METTVVRASVRCSRIWSSNEADGRVRTGAGCLLRLCWVQPRSLNMPLDRPAARRLSLYEDGPRFDEMLRRQGAPLTRDPLRTLQVNVGKLCNMACQHCHVDAGPKRTEVMGQRVAERVIALLEKAPDVALLDITGGAPELNPNFRWLGERARALGRRVIDRCNLSVLLGPGQEELPEFLARQGVELVASLPCYSAGNVEKQRGRGAFDQSIGVLGRLNRLGYGRAGSPLRL